VRFTYRLTSDQHPMRQTPVCILLSIKTQETMPIHNLH